jgi:hypothetical protein
MDSWIHGSDLSHSLLYIFLSIATAKVWFYVAAETASNATALPHCNVALAKPRVRGTGITSCLVREKCIDIDIHTMHPT